MTSRSPWRCAGRGCARSWRGARSFTIGLFSVADALLDAPMAEVLESLPFTDEIQTALLRREGPKGELLSAVIAYERGEFPALPAAGAVPEVVNEGPAAGAMSLAGAYRAALEWAEDAGRAIGDE